MSIGNLILIAHSLISANFNGGRISTDTNKITVIGKAIVIKHQAAVRTDDSLLYYLDGVDDWDVKYKGKKIKVTGKLVTIPEPKIVSYPGINITPQPRMRDGKLLREAKWELVE